VEVGRVGGVGGGGRKKEEGWGRGEIEGE